MELEGMDQCAVLENKQRGVCTGKSCPMCVSGVIWRKLQPRKLRWFSWRSVSTVCIVFQKVRRKSYSYTLAKMIHEFLPSELLSSVDW